jgi:hypothetical protein
VKKRATPAPQVGNRIEGFGVAEDVAKKTWGRPAMPSAAYFRRQADICLRLSLIASDEEVSNRLIIMAREYATKADAIAIKEADAAAERTALPDLEGNQAAVRLAPNAPEPPAEC